MDEAPRLFDLCVRSIGEEILNCDPSNDILSVIYEFPPELFDSLLPCLHPLALQKLQENLPYDFRESFEPTNEYHIGGSRKRGRSGILDAAWRSLYTIRWPGRDHKKRAVSWLDKIGEAKGDSMDDWQQKYWEAHLQDCVDAVAETALLPSYDGSIGEIQIPDAIQGYIGFKDNIFKSTCDYQKFFGHCQQYGIYARHLRLPNVLCVGEMCHLLQRSKLEILEFQWIKYKDHLEGLCKLLNQNSDTLKSIEFIHCKLSPSFVDAICDSVYTNGLEIHGIKHFSIKRSSYLLLDSSRVSDGLTRFLKSGRSLHSFTLCDDQLGRNFARAIFNRLLDASVTVSRLDLSENYISGFLSQFRWKSSNSSLGIGKSLHSLRVLILRSNNLNSYDSECLKQALVHMPNLENLDLSDNPIEDGIGSLITHFTEISSRDSPFIDLRLENCELTCNQVTQLFEALSTMKTPLKVLSVKGNRLGSKIGAPLGKFLCTGIRAVDVEDIGLRSSGFMVAIEEISKGSKLVYINISNNQGGVEAAKFISMLISNSQEVVAIDARYNLMPIESLPVISSGLKASKGKMEHLDLTGNIFCDQIADSASVLAEFQMHGHLSLNLKLSAATNVPYDNDP